MVNNSVYPHGVIIDDSDLAFLAGSESGSKTESTSVSEPDLIQTVERTNDLLTGIIFFLGLIFGAIGMSIFWNRLKGD